MAATYLGSREVKETGPRLQGATAGPRLKGTLTETLAYRLRIFTYTAEV